MVDGQWTLVLEYAKAIMDNDCCPLSVSLTI